MPPLVCHRRQEAWIAWRTILGGTHGRRRSRYLTGCWSETRSSPQKNATGKSRWRTVKEAGITHAGSRSLDVQ